MNPTPTRRPLRRLLPALALPIALGAFGQSASASAPPSSVPDSEPPTTLPEGYVGLVDDTGAITVAVPETWTDVDTAPATNDDGTPLPYIAASTDIQSFIETFDSSGVRFVALAYEADPQVVLDETGLTTGCETIEVQPYTDPVFTGLVQVGTNCGEEGGTWNMVVASPADQTFTAVVQVQSSSPADDEAIEIVLLTFNGTAGASTPGSSTPAASSTAPDSSATGPSATGPSVTGSSGPDSSIPG